ncbi:MAG: glycosyltransferase [Acidimicrobiia bacterium]|nr:glycosyltransferase [Acidimicrobiia bacterium]
MAKILIVTLELAGRVNTFAELGRRLEERGHQVVMTSPADIEGLVEALGLEFRVMSRLRPPGLSDPDVLRVPLTTAIASLRHLRHFRHNREAEILRWDVDGFTAGLHAFDPDLVLCDIEFPMQLMVADREGYRTVAVCDQLALWKRPGLPPLHLPLVPGDGWQTSRPGVELLWVRYRLWKWLRFRLLQLLSGGRDQLSVLREIARRIGYPFRREIQLYQWIIPVTFRTTPTLTFNALELDLPHRPRRNVEYVGPVIDPRPHHQLPNLADEQRLQAVLDRAANRTLIYGGFGAYHEGDDTSFLRSVIDAVGAEPEWDLIVGLGDRFEAGKLGTIPPNVHLFAWAPQRRVLAQADAAVLHGGITTVNESIAAGVPMVVYPYSYNDTPGYAARVRYHGLGVVGNRETDTAEDISEHLQAVLGNAQIAQNLRTMRAAFDDYGTRAVDAVEELL